MLVIAATACQPNQANAPAASPTPSNQATDSPSPSPSPSVLPSPSPSPTSSPAKALCTFPVAGTNANGDVLGYFLTVPTGAKTIARLVFRQSGILYQTVDKPYLLGTSRTLGFYDRAFSRWIPADPAAVSPDGAHFAYASGAPSGPNELHIVDVKTGTDHLITNVGRYYPLDYRADGLYLSERSTSGLWAGSGIFVLDLKTNVIRRLHSSTRTEWWTATLGNFAYGADVNPSDPHPPGGGESSNELVRADLRTGAVVRFQYHPGQAVTVAGITPSGQLLAYVGTAAIRLIDSKGNAISIPGTPVTSSVYIDSARAWFLAGDPRSAAGGSRNSSFFLLLTSTAVHEMDFQWGGSDELAGACH